MEDMVLATAALDTPDLVTLVATDSVTEVTPGDTTASVRLRPSPRLMLMPRLTPTSAMDTLASEAMEDTEDMVLATAALDTPDLVTLVATDSVTEVTPGDTTASVRLRQSPRLMLMPRLTPTTAMDTLA